VALVLLLLAGSVIACITVARVSTWGATDVNVVSSSFALYMPAAPCVIAS